MKHIMLPLAIFSWLLWMLVDLGRVARGKQTVDVEWHTDYVDSNMNYGQGSVGNENK